MRLALVVLGLCALTLLVRLLPAWWLKAEIADIGVYHDMGAAYLRGDNIYAQRLLFPYTPYSQFLPALALRLAELTGWHLAFTLKLFCCVADAITACALLLFLAGTGSGLRKASLWTLAWAVNPVSVLISGYHGNLMALVACLVTLAVIVATVAENSPNRVLLGGIAALLLGLAVALRSFPVLLLPAFVVLFARTLREAFSFAGLAAIPSLASSVPYLIYAPRSFLREVLGYGGFCDFGWLAVLRTLPYLAGEPLIGFYDDYLLALTKPLYLTACVASALLLPFFRRSSLGAAVMLPVLLFFGLYGGVSAQYLVWLVPLAFAAQDKRGLVFSLVAGITLWAFYSLYFPGIISSPLSPRLPTGVATGIVYALGNALLVVGSLVWGTAIVVRELGEPRGDAAGQADWVHRLRSGGSGRLLVGMAVASGIGWLWFLAKSVGRAVDVVRSTMP